MVDVAEGFKCMAFHGFLGGERKPRRTVCDLRGISGGDVAVLPVEKGFELGQVLRRGILAHTVVVLVEVSLFVEDRNDLRRETVMRSAEHAVLMRAEDARVAVRGEFV